MELNNRTMFKCFKFIDNVLKHLNEATENPSENDVDMKEGDTTQETPDTEEQVEMEDSGSEEEMTSEPKEDPSQIADADAGVFVSPIAKANWANMMLKFLKNKRPEMIIPTQYETVTTENADEVIEFVKNTDIIVDDSFGNELNGI